MTAVRIFTSWRDHHPLLRSAIGVWVALVIGVSFRAAIAKPGAGSVLPIYQKAALDWLEGRNLYKNDSGEPYRYHPAVAVSFVPWTALPARVAEILWRWLGVALLLWGLSSWLRHMLPQPLSPPRYGMLLLLSAPLALQSINNAQINTHLIGMILLGLVSAFRQRWNQAALLLAAAAIFKIYPIAVGLLLAALFFRQFAFRFLLALAAISALPFLTQIPDYVADQYRNWLEFLGRDNRFNAQIDLATRDLAMLLRVGGHPISERTYQGIELVSASGVALVCLALQRRVADQRVLFTAILNLGCLWMILLGPATESNTYTLLAPTAALLLVAPLSRPSRWRMGLLVLGYALIVFSTLAVALPGGRRVQEWALQPAGALLLLICAIAEIVNCLSRHDPMSTPLNTGIRNHDASRQAA